MVPYHRIFSSSAVIVRVEIMEAEIDWVATIPLQPHPSNNSSHDSLSASVDPFLLHFGTSINVMKTFAAKSAAKFKKLMPRLSRELKLIDACMHYASIPFYLHKC
mmetsp:Transcript_26231/g.63917  ORF Transcript_26231/g.63917 Transcript_26231/m.63917 type:complete len:105 (-) Transcript_26231:250-564(-)